MAYDYPPSTVQRWIAEQRTGLRVGIVALVAILSSVSVWSYSTSRTTSLLGLATYVFVGGMWLIIVGSISTSVDRWDLEHPELGRR